MIERRRMQNINLGFTSLKRLLPPTEKKQTKAAILQQAVQHIMRLQRTVIQVRENNNILRQNLADERKQRLCCRNQLEVLISEKYARQDFQGPPSFFPPAVQTKGQSLTPPHEDPSDSALNRWSPVLHCSVETNSNDYSVFDLPSCRDSRKRGLTSLMRKRNENLDGKRELGRRSNQFVRKSSNEACGDETAPSYSEVSSCSLSRDNSDAGSSDHLSRGNNLHCIVDAINLIEKS